MEEKLQTQPLQDEEVTQLIMQEKKRVSVLLFISTILFLLIVGLGVYILHKEGYWTKQEEQKKEERKEVTEVEEEDKAGKGEKPVVEEAKETITKDFVGEYVRAKIPEGWSIKEFKDGEGTEFAEPGYKGLSALNIYQGEKMMLTLQTVQLGAGAPVKEIYRFKDYSPEEEQRTIQRLKEMGVEVKIVDYTNTPYIEYPILGTITRRVEKQFFYDTVKDNSTFEASNVPDSINLNLKIGENEYSLGYYKFSEEITDNQLLIIDKILTSLRVK